MRYSLGDIEKQIESTLKDVPSNEGVLIAPHAGEINLSTFTDATKQEGFIHMLPLIMYQYQGKRRFTTDSTKKLNVHELRYRFFVGAESLRLLDEAKRNAYDLLATVYDSIHGHWLNTDQPLDRNLPFLAGDVMAGVNAISPFMETEGEDERLMVNLPHIVVYYTDYIVRVIA